MTPKMEKIMDRVLSKDELNLIRIQERLSRISKGDWKDDIDGDTGDLFVQMGQSHRFNFCNMEGSDGECHANTRFIAHAPTDIKALLNEVKRLKEENRSLFQDYVELREWVRSEIGE